VEWRVKGNHFVAPLRDHKLDTTDCTLINAWHNELIELLIPTSSGTNICVIEQCRDMIRNGVYKIVFSCLRIGHRFVETHRGKIASR